MKTIKKIFGFQTPVSFKSGVRQKQIVLVLLCLFFLPTVLMLRAGAGVSAALGVSTDSISIWVWVVFVLMVLGSLNVTSWVYGLGIRLFTPYSKKDMPDLWWRALVILSSSIVVMMPFWLIQFVATNVFNESKLSSISLLLIVIPFLFLLLWLVGFIYLMAYSGRCFFGFSTKAAWLSAFFPLGIVLTIFLLPALIYLGTIATGGVYTYFL